MATLTIGYTSKGRGYSGAWSSGENPSQGAYETKWSGKSQWGQFRFNDPALSGFDYDLNTVTKISVKIVLAEGAHGLNLYPFIFGKPAKVIMRVIHLPNVL